MQVRSRRGDASGDPVLWGVLGVWAVALAVSGLVAFDRGTWAMEVAPLVIGAPLLVATRARFPLTRLLLVLIGLHGLILALGGAYTYARVPPGFWVQDALGLARNPYDRFGHFAQGFVPAILAREILLRTTPLRRGRMLALLVTSVCLGFSALYELIEWGAAMALGQGSDAFLGTQGDPWDTQWDMACALLGALAAQALLARAHDRALAARGLSPPSP